jgi:cytochrome c-type biogenesis protein CcmH
VRDARPASDAPSATRRGPLRGRRVWPELALLLVVVGVSLVIGSGLASSGQPSDAQRAAVIDSQLRCPSCEDLSVAQSNASSAIAVRHEVAQLVAEGRSAQQVEDELVAQYGESILLRPPSRGLSALVWIVPVVAALCAFGALALLFWRRTAEFERLRREGP